MRKLVAAPLLALALAVPAATPALAAHAGDSASGSHSSAHAAGHQKGTHQDSAGHKGAARRVFVDTGTVTAVDQTGSTLTFTLRHGTNRKLRGQDVTVSVTTATVIRRDRAVASLGDVAVGDRIAVECYRTPTSFVAVRVQDRGAAGTGTSDPTATSTPGPSATPTASPSVSPSPAVTATPTTSPI